MIKGDGNSMVLNHETMMAAVQQWLSRSTIAPTPIVTGIRYRASSKTFVVTMRERKEKP